MKKKINKFFVVVLLCFSCILLFRSANIGTDEGSFGWRQDDARGMAYEGDIREDTECNCGYSWRSIKFYLDGRRYVTLDVVVLTSAMVLVFVLVINRQ